MTVNFPNRLTPEFNETQQVTIDRFKETFRKIGYSVWKDRIGRIGLLLIVLFLVLAIFAPWIAPHDPGSINYADDGSAKVLESPSLEHPLGTDNRAQDIFSQWIYGTRVTLLVAFFAGIGVATIGTTIGLLSGYYKGSTDLALMRIVDVLYGIPVTPLILVLVLFFGTSLTTIILAFFLILWRTMARIVRAQTLSMSERAFVKSAKAAGASDRRIMFYHIAPNLLPIILVETTFVMAGAISIEAGIAFLGFGPSNMLSWGGMLEATFAAGGLNVWWWVLPPGLGITFTILSFFYISRALESVVNTDV